MKRKSLIIGAIALAVMTFVGCKSIGEIFADPIIGSWQQVSVNGSAPLLVNLVTFTKENTYTGTTSGVTTNSGTWSVSGSTYTLTGSFFGFISTTSSISPVFSSSNNTMTFTDESGYAEVYNKK